MVKKYTTKHPGHFDLISYSFYGEIGEKDNESHATFVAKELWHTYNNQPDLEAMFDFRGLCEHFEKHYGFVRPGTNPDSLKDFLWSDALQEIVDSAYPEFEVTDEKGHYLVTALRDLVFLRDSETLNFKSKSDLQNYTRVAVNYGECLLRIALFMGEPAKRLNQGAKTRTGQSSANSARHAEAVCRRKLIRDVFAQYRSRRPDLSVRQAIHFLSKKLSIENPHGGFSETSIKRALKKF